MSNKINDIKVREKMKDSLKCMVCFENKPNFVQFCKNCGRYLGYFSCVSNLQDFPQPRKPLYKLNCPTCESDIQQRTVPLFIPALPTILGLKDIPRPHIIRVPSNPWWRFLYIFYIDTAESAYSYCLTFLLWGRTSFITILRYHVMKNFVFKFYVADLIGKSNQSYIVFRKVSN